MPVYVLKRYHKLIPTSGEVWTLGRETAFEAKDDAEAIATGKFQHATAFRSFGGLTLVIDPDGRRIWESVQTANAA